MTTEARDLMNWGLQGQKNDEALTSSVTEETK